MTTLYPLVIYSLHQSDPYNFNPTLKFFLSLIYETFNFKLSMINYLAMMKVITESVLIPGAKNFNIKHGNLTLQHMSRHKAKKIINSRYIKEIDDISNKLKNAAYVCTTADIWSGRNRRFLGVTAHYLEEKNLERHSAALACRVFPGTHSYDRIAEQLDDINLSFGLDIEKVVATIADNGSNFVKAFKEFGMDNPATFVTALSSGTVIPMWKKEFPYKVRVLNIA
uniref:Uncharacterized protein n=1 Tax=Trichogramma kaykai TaxID=54128 RepID=A0ABD2VUE9_9HYME